MRNTRLIGYDAYSKHRASLEESSTSINYLTGKKIATLGGGEEGRKKRRAPGGLERKALSGGRL